MTKLEELEQRIVKLEQIVFPLERPPVRMISSDHTLNEINKALGTKFRPVHANLKFITQRLVEGATEQELVDVARFKKQEWGSDPEMRKYLRIETLYNATKFQSYLAEVEAAKERMSQYDELR